MATKPIAGNQNGGAQKQPAMPPEPMLSEPEIICRIDAIIDELVRLREVVVSWRPGNHEADMTEKLFGALGEGTWDEWDPDLYLGVDIR